MKADEIFLAALAMMDHPNIAKVLDAGTTGSEPAALSEGCCDDPVLAVISWPIGNARKCHVVVQLQEGSTYDCSSNPDV
jgi:hypothetical protein